MNVYAQAMFIPTLRNQTSPAQKEAWLPAAESNAILGCYAQTEMGEIIHHPHITIALHSACYVKPNRQLACAGLLFIQECIFFPLRACDA